MVPFIDSYLDKTQAKKPMTNFSVQTSQPSTNWVYSAKHEQFGFKQVLLSQLFIKQSLWIRVRFSHCVLLCYVLKLLFFLRNAGAALINCTWITSEISLFIMKQNVFVFIIFKNFLIFHHRWKFKEIKMLFFLYSYTVMYNGFKQFNK